MELAKKKCVACDGATPRLDAAQMKLLLPEIPGWKAVEDNRKLQRQFKLKDFKASMAFINKMADIAEAEQHHPDFFVRYSAVDVTLWTHAIGGLSENDFILAAKIDTIVP